LSTLTVSFDAPATESAPIEVHGPGGSLSVPDPNTFTGAVRVHKLGGSHWEELPVAAGYTAGGRGLGLAELMVPHGPSMSRVSGDLALHVLDVMVSVLRSADEGRRVEIASRAVRPAAVPLAREPDEDDA
jgi:predicted dehydrogenase